MTTGNSVNLGRLNGRFLVHEIVQTASNLTTNSQLNITFSQIKFLGLLTLNGLVYVISFNNPFIQKIANVTQVLIKISWNSVN